MGVIAAAALIISLVRDGDDDVVMAPEPPAATATTSIAPSATPRLGSTSPLPPEPVKATTPAGAAPQTPKTTAPAAPNAPQLATVPYVVGRDLGTAAALLARSGLTFTTQCTHGRMGVVEGQQPPAGQRLAIGSSVTLTVSGRCHDDHDWGH